MKKTLVALAVTAAITAPAIAMADITLYGSVRGQLQTDYGTSDATDDISVTSGASRWGIKGSNDLGNGMSAIYKLEEGIDLNDGGVESAGRLGYVGLAGGFGAVVLGRQWTPFYNTVAAPHDIFVSGSSAAVDATGRAGNALAYALPSGMPVSGAVALVMDNGSGEDIDAVNAGFNAGLGPVNIGVGYHKNETDDDPIVGATIGGKFAGFGLNVGMADNGNTDSTAMTVTATYGPVALQYKDFDNADERTAFTAMYTHKLAKSTRLQFQVNAEDAETGTFADADPNMTIRLRTDF